MEPGNRMDKFAICVKINEKIVVHPEGLQSQSFTSCAVMRTQVLGQKLLIKGVILAMESKCKSLANWVYFGQPKICISLTYRINENERNSSFDIYLVFLFAFSRVKISSYPKELVSGGQKMVRENECSSYSRFELTSDFYQEVLGNVQGTVGNISR